MLCCLSAWSQDVGFVAVMKGQEFHQTSPDIVSIGEWRTWYETGEVQNETEHREPLHIFEVYAVGTAIDAISSGSVTVSGGGVVPLQQDFLGDVDVPEIGIENGYDSPLELNTARPDGSYNVQFVTKNQGTLNIPLSLTGGAYPPVPHVTNFSTLQTATASSPITIQWSPMGGTEDDFIHVQVMQIGGMDDGTIVWETGMPLQTDALDGTDIDAVIPPGTLQAGTDYHAEVLFVKTVDIEMSPAFAIAGYYKLTGFRIRTAALAGQPLGAKFLRASPRDTWSEIPVDSAVAFHFSHPMSTAHISIDWTYDNNPLNTGNFNYQWIQGNKVLLCTFSSNTPGEYLPPGCEIGWTLNLGGFSDARGFPLSGTASGSFRTSTDSEPGCPPDIGFISILKTKYFLQDGLAPEADGRYEASVEVETNASNRLKSASVTGTMAGGRSGPLYADPWDASEYEAPGEYGSKTDLDRIYPNGDYRFDFVGLADGSKSVTLSLGTEDQYPDPPTITNLETLQAVDPAAPVLITWNAMPGWNNDSATIEPGDGVIELEVIDKRGWDVVYVDAFELENGTFFEIPAGTLKPGKTYEARLFFIRVTDLDLDSYPGAFAVAAFESQTLFTIKTTGQPLMPALALERIGTTARITASGGDPDASYVLQTSSDMSRWTLLNVSGIAQGGTSQYDDFDARFFKSRFYRMGEFDFSVPPIPPVSIQGTVWTNSSHNTPVPGAIVSTSLDGCTTTTDAQGRFFLITDIPSMGGTTPYTIIITSGTQTKPFGPMNWGDQPREQIFEMAD